MDPKPGHKPNRLANESSPYLLQHAHNPVDWYPWGPEAFAEARRRNVPIFLSIGYSTCYWCHVMERESFESEEIAKLMNELFVNVKVDREERPDVDDIYMTATVAMTQHGGWPMSVFLEPESLKPFYCGTYFPAKPMQGRPSFPQVLEGLSSAWREQRDAVLQQADALAEAVEAELAAKNEATPVGERHVALAVQALLRSLDRTNGGFGGAPKFPQPTFPDLLIETRAVGADDATTSALDQSIRVTLDAMMTGGLRDQIGGGFHRYSIDAYWTVPHFEKMLYDNAQLAVVYARAAALYNDDEYRRVVRTTLDYVLREMTDPAGGFWSAQDAEVDGREGLNYLWTPEDARAVLNDDEFTLADELYGISTPNFQDPHHPDEPVRRVLRLDARVDGLAERRGETPGELHARLDAINARLYEARQQRKQPRLDDKVLAAWNGLMIAGMCDGAEALGDEKYTDAAESAARFILEHMIDPQFGLFRVSRDGRAKTPAFLEDHAFLALGLIALHRRRPNAGWLDEAIGLVEKAEAAFGDGAAGFFDTRADQDDLFVRTRSTRDGAIPTGQSVMIHVLIDLFEITGEQIWTDKALGALSSMSSEIERNPTGASNATRALLRLLTNNNIAKSSDVFEQPGAAPDPSVDPAGADPASTPVEVFSSTDRIELSDDESAASFTLGLRIAEGYHIVAADPGPEGEGLVPLRVEAAGQGVAVYADYPDGELYGGLEEAGVGPIRVHHGEVSFEVALELDAEWVGEPKLLVTYQACTDSACLAPMTVELAVEIVRK